MELSLAQLAARVADMIVKAGPATCASSEEEGEAELPSREQTDAGEAEAEFLMRVGRLVHDFFRHGHSLPPRQDLELVWPGLTGVPVVQVLAIDAAKMRKACSQSLHALLATRNMRETIKNAEDCCSTQTTYCKKLSLSLSSAMGLARDFHERELSYKTNATVTISEEAGEDRLVLRAEGSRRALSDLRVELTSLANSARTFQIGMPIRKTSKYFMEGSTFMMVRNSPKFNVKLGFGDCRGGYHPIHQSHQRSCPLLPARFVCEDSVLACILDPYINC